MEVLKGILKDAQGCRDGSGVQSACCSCRGPECSFQSPLGSSQPSITPVLKDLMPSSDTYKHCTHEVHIHADKTPKYIR